MAQNQTPTLCWPPFLRSDNAYKYRKVLIHVLESPGFTGAVKTVFDKIGSHLKTLGDAGNANSPGTLSDTVKNLNAAYDAEVERSTILTIALPLPNELSDDQTHDWETTTGISGAIGAGLQDQTIGEAVGGKLGSGLASKVTGVIPGLGAGFEAGKNITVKQALGAAADTAGLRKPLADPGYFQNYNGSQPRTFSMTFDFIPQNAGEALEIMEIIMKLKEHSSPSLQVGGVSMLAPNYFDIDVSNPYISALISMQGVVLKDLSVNYGADGAMQQFPDGQPKYIQLKLTFVERKMRHAGQFRKQKAKAGG